jgi:ABC-type glutathione transport system ATPase component
VTEIVAEEFPVETSSALSVDSLTVTFPLGPRRRLTAIEDVTLDLARGDSLGIVGESGCGKTTLARCIVGLQRPDRGTIRIDGDLVGAKRNAHERRAVQLVFQDPYSSLNPRMTIGAMLTQLLATHDLAHGTDADERSRELLALVGLPADALSRHPGAFSGGQRQRIAIARALAVEPRLIVADEPVSALDVSIQATILELFADLRDHLGISLVMISHNLAAVRHVCDRVAVMYLGKVVEVGDTQHPFASERRAAGETTAARPSASLGRRAAQPSLATNGLLVSPPLSSRGGDLLRGGAAASLRRGTHTAKSGVSLPQRRSLSHRHCPVGGSRRVSSRGCVVIGRDASA